MNATIGEHLQPLQWFSALGLCGLAAAFFFKGHLSDLSRRGKATYLKLVLISAVLAVFDQEIIRNSNWYAALIVTNIILVCLAFALNRARGNVLKDALFHESAVLAGVFYMATELVKNYQQVSINPVSVVITVQASTKPVILILSALLWKERTVKEQLVWGALAFVVTLPLFL